jgi:hypothetical protein
MVLAALLIFCMSKKQKKTSDTDKMPVGKPSGIEKQIVSKMPGSDSARGSLPQITNNQLAVKSKLGRVLPLVLQGALVVGGAFMIYEFKKQALDDQHDQTLGVLKGRKLDCFLPEVRDKYQTLETVKYVPIVVHRILPKDGEFGAVYQDFVDRGLKGLNSTYAKSKLSFYLQGVRDIKDDDLFDRDSHEKLTDTKIFSQKLQSVATQNSVQHVVNIFILPEISSATFGEAYGAFLDRLGQKGENQIFISYDNNNLPEQLFPHEMGHIFTLRHPHEDDVPGNKNCDKTGDMLCDTPPDPAKYNEYNKVGCKVDDQCKIVECGNPAFMANPPLSNNIMSYYHGCQTSFTPEQEKVINCSAQNHKADLLRDKPENVEQISNVIKVKCDAASAPTIQEGIDKVTERGGGVVQVCAGTYPESLTFSGIKSNKYYSDKYHIKTTLEAAKDADGKGQEVIIDGRGKKSMVTVRTYSSPGAGNDKQKVGGLYLTIRGITFAHGEDRDHQNIQPLFDFSGLKNLTLDEVTVKDTVSEGLALMSLPKEAHIQRSTFSGVSMERGGGFFQYFTHLFIDKTRFVNNFSTFQSKGKVPKQSSMIQLSGDKDSNQEVRFSDVTYEGNLFKAVTIFRGPEGLTQEQIEKLPIKEYARMSKTVDFAEPITNAVCVAKDMNCK